jgi:hypothetical protein
MVGDTKVCSSGTPKEQSAESRIYQSRRLEVNHTHRDVGMCGIILRSLEDCHSEENCGIVL